MLISRTKTAAFIRVQIITFLIRTDDKSCTHFLLTHQMQTSGAAFSYFTSRTTNKLRAGRTFLRSATDTGSIPGMAHALDPGKWSNFSQYIFLILILFPPPPSPFTKSPVLIHRKLSRQGEQTPSHYHEKKERNSSR